MNEVHSVYEPEKLCCRKFGGFILLVMVAEAPPKFKDLREVFLSICFIDRL